MSLSKYTAITVSSVLAFISQTMHAQHIEPKWDHYAQVLHIAETQKPTTYESRLLKKLHTRSLSQAEENRAIRWHNRYGISKEPKISGLILYMACQRQNNNLAFDLIEKGACVHVFYNNETPLTHACKNNATKLAKKLLAAGADPNMYNKSNIPLLQAYLHNNFELAYTLVNAGANVNKTSGHKITNILDDILNRLVIFSCQDTYTTDQLTQLATSIINAGLQTKYYIPRLNDIIATNSITLSRAAIEKAIEHGTPIDIQPEWIYLIKTNKAHELEELLGALALKNMHLETIETLDITIRAIKNKNNLNHTKQLLLARLIICNEQHKTLHELDLQDLFSNITFDRYIFENPVFFHLIKIALHNKFTDAKGKKLVDLF